MCFKISFLLCVCAFLTFAQGNNNRRIEQPNAVDDFSTDGTSQIWVIILGYGIPLAFDDDGETVAIASRLHLLGKSISNKKINHTFDRRNFRFFDADDAC